MGNKLMITISEDELFDLMCEFGEVEYKLSNFLIVLEALKDHYDEEKKRELYANISMVIGFLTHVQEEFSRVIIKTDEFMLKQNK